MLLKAGDKWLGETFPASGAGLFDAATFNSVYASTLASQTAAYQGGTPMPGGLTFTSYKNLLLTAGLSSSEATTRANEYCRMKAVVDAEVAAHAAANASASTKRVLVTRYGSGANPVLDGLGTTNFGVNADGTVSAWKFEHIEVKNYLGPGFWIDTALLKAGLWLDDVSSHDNRNPTNSPIGNVPLLGGRYLGAGFWFGNAQYTHISNSTFDNNDCPHLLGGGDNSGALYENVSANHSQYLHPFIQDATGVVHIGGVYDHQCDGPGVNTGSAGMFVKHATDVVFTGVTFQNTAAPFLKDGEGLDIEGGTVNLTIFDCVFADNAGTALSDFNNDGGQPPNQGTKVDNSTFTNNGIGFPANSRANLIFIPEAVQQVTNRLTFTRCTVVKATSPAQPFLYAWHGYTDPTDVITDNWPNGVFA